jgi:alpha-tubulin suppressor-like RCC1 family protein
LTHRAIALLSALALITPLALATLALPAGASSVPGTPGTPVAHGMQGGAALRWAAPSDAGTPPLTGYRVESNDGSGWSTAAVHHGADAIAGGLSHSCALLDSGAVKCWGDNTDGQLGLGDTAARGDNAGEMGNSLPAVSLGTGRTAIAIAVGDLHTCALLDTGNVKCWGDNTYGELGQGDTNNRGDNAGEMGDNLLDVDLGTGRKASAITAGHYFTCALLDNATVKCWGRNDFGQLGQGDTNNRGDNAGEMGDNLLAINLGTGRTAIAIAAGGDHMCALLDNATVKCWGHNDDGQLGQGDTVNRGDAANEMGDNLFAVDLGTGRTAVSIAAGQHHTCAVLDNASVKCWGDNGNGQLGLGDTAFRGDNPGEMGDNLPAVNLGTGRTATAITAGAFHTCAVLDNATVKCWGNAGLAQLGYGDITQRGDNANEMGNNLPAVSLGTGRTATAITAGAFHTCVLLDNASVKCWGDNSSGQSGLGDTNNRGDQANEMGDNLPVVAVAGHSLIAIGAGGNHSCAIIDDGTLKCWGSNSFGQLGQGDTNDRGGSANQMGTNLLPVDLGAGRTAVQVVGGDTDTCARLDDGSVKCWGRSFAGELGQGNTNTLGDQANEMGNNLPAVNLGTGRTATSITAGSNHVCALLDDATVKCWGRNLSGQLGRGNTTNIGDIANEMGDNLLAVNLGTGHTATAISAGGDHTCAILDDATLKCWGDNHNGKLGLGDTQNRGDQGGQMGNNLPAVDLGTGRTALAVAAGVDYTCALLDNHTVKCWGWGGSGRLGYGDTSDRGSSPNQMGDNLPTVDLGTGRTATKIIAAAASVCVVLDNASVKCWGLNTSGSLGLGNNTNHGDGTGAMGDGLPAVDLGSGRTATAIATGGMAFHVCALLDNGTMKCWGANGSGQLGLGDTTSRGNTSGQMGDNLPVVSLSAPLGSGPATSAIVRLAPGTYQFRIVALNSAGESSPSAASSSVTVTGVPGAPTAVVASGAVGSASLTWTAPASDGGFTITDYAVSVFNSTGGPATGVTGLPTQTVGSATTSLTFTGLTNGTSYTFRVAAVNVVGAGPQSALSNVVVPSNFVVPATAGNPNGYDTGTVGDSSITLTASGSWCYANATCFGPGGDAPLGGAGYLEPTAHRGALVGRLGTSGSWEEIGAGPETLNGSGELYLAINDQTGGYGDNSGSLQVYVVANLQFTTAYDTTPDVLAGTPLGWTGDVTNNNTVPITNVTLFASAANGLPTARTSVPTWRITGSNATTPCTLQTAGTTIYSCVIPSIDTEQAVQVKADIFTQALAPQTLTDEFAVGISDQTGGCFGFCPIHVPVAPTGTDLVTGLQSHITAPATVQAGTTLTISGYVENTSPDDDINGIATFGAIDKGSITSSTGCGFTNNSSTGATDRCPGTGTFNVPAGTDTSATPGSIDINTTGLAGQTIHYTGFGTSPDLGGSTQVVTGSVFVTAAAGGIAISTPANGATLAATVPNDFTAFPSPTGGDNVTSVDFTVDNGPPVNVAAPGPYTTTLAPNTLTPGTRTLTATMHQDNGGPNVPTSITVHVAAAPIVSITPPSGFSSGGTLTTAKTFTALATPGATATIASVVWQIDGNISVPSAAASPYTATINPATLVLTNGSHILTATATDSLGQTSSDTFNFTVPLATVTIPSVTSLADSVTPGGDAAWTVTVHNSSGDTAHHLVLTLNATSTDPSSTVTALTFDTAAINGALHLPPATATCHAGTGTSVVCNLGELAGTMAVQFPVFVSTDGITNGSTITGSVVAAAANANATSPGSLGSVSVQSCGDVCTQGVAAAGTNFNSPTDQTTQQEVTLSTGLESAAHGVKFGHPFRLRIIAPRNARVTFRPRLESTPSIKITLSSVDPVTATDPVDTHLCPTAITCVGEISGVDGDFSPYTNRIDPIVVVIIAKWGATVPGTHLWMQKPAVNNGPLPAAIQLPACVINATTRAFNTACVLPEIVKSLTVNNVTTMTTYDTVLFTGDDPHFARR